METLYLMLILMIAVIPVFSGDAHAEEKAYFAGGCFWCVEHDMEKIPGVKEVVSGYAGGHVESPAYEDVSSGQTGHRESVMVVYDPEKISYRELVDRFWRLIDPLDGGGQFCDRGFQYTGAVFVRNDREKADAEASRAAAEAALGKGSFAVDIVSFTNFYPAEDYHQNYAANNPIRYKYYRHGCGRDRRVDSLWGEGRR
jgi:methionine-S-sulfoxide reductase